MADVELRHPSPTGQSDANSWMSREASYKAIFDSIDQGFCIAELVRDADQRAVDLIFREVNASFARHNGLVDAVGKSVSSFFPDYDRTWIERLDHVARTGVPEQSEGFGAATGRWYRTHWSRFGDAGSDLVAVVFEDISERKQAELSLLKSEERRELALQAAELGAWEYDLETNVWHLDPRAQELYNLSVPSLEFLRETVASIVHPDDMDRMLEVLGRSTDVEGDGRYDIDYRVARGDGGFRWLRAWGKAEFAGEGADRRAVRVVGLGRDVTDEKEGIAALAASEETYRTLFTQMDEAYAVIEVMDDGEGNWVDFLYLEVNPAFMRHTGMPYPVGRTVTQILGTPNPRWAELYGRAAETGESVRVKESELTLGRTFDLNIFRIGGEGSRRVAVLFTDVTDRLRRERDREFLAAISETLGRVSTEDEIVFIVGQKLVEHLGVSCFYLVDVDEDRDEVTVRHYWHALDVPDIRGTFPLSSFVAPGGLEQLRAGKATVVNDVQTEVIDDIPFTEALREGAAAQKIDSFVAAPYRQGGRLKAYFTVADSQPREWSSLEVQLIQDVTTRVLPRIERVRAETALRVNEARLRRVLDGMGEAFGLFAPDFTTLEHNPEALRIDGRERDAIIGRSLWEVYPGTKGSPVGDLLEYAMAEREPVTLEHRYSWDADRSLWLEMRAYPTEDGMLAVFWRDVTERREVQDALRSSERKYRALFESIDEGFALYELIFDGDGQPVDAVIHEVNPAYETLTRRANVVGKRVSEVTGRFDPSWARLLAEVARSGQPQRVDRFSTDSDRWFDVFIHPAPDADIGWVSIVFTDITDRRMMVESLQASEERLRAVVEETTDYAIFTTDADGLIEDWFPGAEAVFGWSPEEIVGQYFGQTFTPEDQAAGVPERELREASSEGVVPNVRWHRHANGGRVFIEGVARGRFASDGTFVGMLKIGRDATAKRMAELIDVELAAQARKELEDRIAASTTELRSLSRRLITVQEEERRYLARELHDEIGQVLTGLGLTLGTENASDTSKLRDARVIVAELTEQVRQLSVDLRPAVLDSYGLLAAVRWHLDRLEQRGGMRVTLDAVGVDARFPDTIEIAAFRIIQEALTNVARHSQVLEARVTLEAYGDHLVIQIEDRGRGFDPRMRTTGTGLGNMRERAELLGGTFSIVSHPGAGTTVTAVLPLTGDDEQGSW